jgi:dTDP-glucose 4,6-dehydratase
MDSAALAHDPQGAAISESPKLTESQESSASYSSLPDSCFLLSTFSFQLFSFSASPSPMPTGIKSSRPLAREDLSHILDHTRELWEEARGKSFFITGGTGFFGMWLLESFAHINDALGLGARATVLTRDPVSFVQKAPHLTSRHDLTFIQGDIRDFALPEGNFDCLIHAATEASARLNHEAPHEMLDAIIAGMRRVLDFAAQANVKKLLFTSSGAVYGPQPSGLTHVPEDFMGAPDCLNPASAYGEGKRVAELMAAIHAKRHGTEIKIARCFAFVGPHLPLDTHFAIGNFLRDAMAGNPIKIGGDGTPFRSYLYAADLAIWLWTILFKGQSCRPYNVGSGFGVPIRDLATTVAETLNPGLAVEIAGSSLPGQSPSRYVPDVSRASQELGLCEEILLPEALRRTAAWQPRNFH